MKRKWVIITSIAVVVAASSATVGALTLQPQKEIISVNESTPSEALEVPQPEETVIVPSEPVEQPQSAPAPVISDVQAVPTNEELKIQYGWTTDPFMTAINSIIGMVPQFFTDEMREGSFAYLDEVCSKLGPNISYCAALMRTNNDKVAMWIYLGKKAGVDTSIYE